MASDDDEEMAMASRPRPGQAAPAANIPMQLEGPHVIVFVVGSIPCADHVPRHSDLFPAALCKTISLIRVMYVCVYIYIYIYINIPS